MTSFRYTYPDGTPKSEAFEPRPIDTPQYLDDHEEFMVRRQWPPGLKAYIVAAALVIGGVVWWIVS